MSASNFSTARGHRVQIGDYVAYADAERAVDRLADERFPVEHLTIVGCDLQLHERVYGRLSWARAAIGGAGTGAWFGLLVGLLFTLFTATVRGDLAILIGSTAYGALFGAGLGLAGYGLMRGRHDFVSHRSLEPARYLLLVDAEHAAEAERRLANIG